MTPNRIVAFILTVSVTVPTLAEVSPAVLQAEQDRAALVEKVAPTVVCIFGRDGGGGGSGVLISPDGLDQCRPILFGL